MVKKLILVVALLLTLYTSIFAPTIAQAEAVGWARIIEDDVYLYSTMDSDKKTFALEKSYYVEILGEAEQMYFVAVMQNDTDFPKITGYVYKSQVTLCAVLPIAPYYPTVKVTVTSNSAPIRLSPLPSANSELTATNTQQLSYYGEIVSYGTSWYYVYYGGSFGYVEASNVSQPNIPLHPTPLPSKPAATVPSTPSTTEPTDEPSTVSASPTSEILLIVFVVVLAVGLTLALFLPGNIKKRDSNVFEQDI